MAQMEELVQQRATLETQLQTVEAYSAQVAAELDVERKLRAAAEASAAQFRARLEAINSTNDQIRAKADGEVRKLMSEFEALKKGREAAMLEAARLASLREQDGGSGGSYDSSYNGYGDDGMMYGDDDEAALRALLQPAPPLELMSVDAAAMLPPAAGDAKPAPAVAAAASNGNGTKSAANGAVAPAVASSNGASSKRSAASKKAAASAAAAGPSSPWTMVLSGSNGAVDAPASKLGAVPAVAPATKAAKEPARATSARSAAAPGEPVVSSLPRIGRSRTSKKAVASPPPAAADDAGSGSAGTSQADA